MIQEFRKLNNATITNWSGVEMALSEGRQPVETWDDPIIPYLQMVFIDIKLSDNRKFRITTVQSGNEWGLYIHTAGDAGDSESDWAGIFRKVDIEFIPCGKIRDLRVSVSNKLVNSVSFMLGSSTISLRAGEVYEELDGSFRVGLEDESVLVQVDGTHPGQKRPVEALR